MNDVVFALTETHMLFGALGLILGVLILIAQKQKM